MLTRPFKITCVLHYISIGQTSSMGLYDKNKFKYLTVSTRPSLAMCFSLIPSLCHSLFTLVFYQSLKDTNLTLTFKSFFAPTVTSLWALFPYIITHPHHSNTAYMPVSMETPPPSIHPQSRSKTLLSFVLFTATISSWNLLLHQFRSLLTASIPCMLPISAPQEKQSCQFGSLLYPST